jgi:hypothetical protein
MEADFIKGSYDFADLMSYVGLDLGMAGLPAEPWGGAQWAPRAGDSVEDKWQRVKPYWPFVRTSAYARCYRRLLKLFFGVDDLDDETVHTVSEGIGRYQHAGVYDEYLHGEYGVRVMLQAQGPDPSPEPEHFAPVYCFDGLAGAFAADSARHALGHDLPSDFPDFRGLVREHLDNAVSNGIVGLKIGGTARRRPLDFVPHSAEDVQGSYRYLLQQADDDWQNPQTCGRLKPFQDAAHWIVFEKAGELGLPIQAHSGLEFMQPWDGRPTALIPSLTRFPDTRFAIFHGSYPHMAELTGLAKSFPNVYLDLAWFHLLSERQARTWLAEWLDVLPHNKLFAFGGDVFLFFGTCSHLETAQENIAAVLAERVAGDLCDIDEAEWTARLLFHDNPWSTFRFENWKGQ